MPKHHAVARIYSALPGVVRVSVPPLSVAGYPCRSGFIATGTSLPSRSCMCRMPHIHTQEEEDAARKRERQGIGLSERVSEPTRLNMERKNEEKRGGSTDSPGKVPAPHRRTTLHTLLRGLTLTGARDDGFRQRRPRLASVCVGRSRQRRGVRSHTRARTRVIGVISAPYSRSCAAWRSSSWRSMWAIPSLRAPSSP